MLKDKKTHTLQIRMDEENYEKLKQLSFLMGTTPSGLARQLIQMSINASESVLMPSIETMKEKQLELTEGKSENYED